MDEIKQAIEQLARAVYDEGPEPLWHRQVMKGHRKEWPTLWDAIDRVLGAKETNDG